MWNVTRQLGRPPPSSPAAAQPLPAKTSCGPHLQRKHLRCCILPRLTANQEACSHLKLVIVDVFQAAFTSPWRPFSNHRLQPCLFLSLHCYLNIEHWA